MLYLLKNLFIISMEIKIIDYKSHSSNISFVTSLLLNKINKVEDQKIKNILLDIVQGKIKNKTQLKRKYNLKEKELSEIYQKLRK